MDIPEFIADIMDFLTPEDVEELRDKAGVKFTFLDGVANSIVDCDGKDPTWEDLCYVCCWMGFKRELPGNILNRMVFGEGNRWVKLCMTRHMPYWTKMSDLFNLAG